MSGKERKSPMQWPRRTRMRLLTSTCQSRRSATTCCALYTLMGGTCWKGSKGLQMDCMMCSPRRLASCCRCLYDDMTETVWQSVMISCGDKEDQAKWNISSGTGSWKGASKEVANYYKAFK